MAILMVLIVLHNYSYDNKSFNITCNGQGQIYIWANKSHDLKAPLTQKSLKLRAKTFIYSQVSFF